ncbi:MAG: ABC transporter substrate-binding protein [Alphaproteobacteria bacterium]|nr:MAG: ABC transporter substrate-binding protein [Alphaproteobacteria bacterium]
MRIWVAAMAGFALGLAGPPLARAEVSEVRIVAQNGSNYLPLFVMQGQKLVEKHLAAKGMPATQVVWNKLAGPSAIIDSFLAGAVHFSGQGVPSTALIWDRTRSGIGAKAVSAMVASNIWLMTRKPELKSLRDLTDKDRIALPSIKTSAQALFLWTTAEKEFGAGQWGRLDHMTVSLPHPDAMAAVLNPNGEITVHAATSPYADLERKAGLRPITDLYAVEGGAVTGLNFVATEQFRKSNPITYDGVVAAFNEAVTWINSDKPRAAQFYLDISKEKMSLADLTAIVTAPDYVFGQTPHGIGRAMEMMHRAGMLKTTPQSWKDMYFPEAQLLAGD